MLRKDPLCVCGRGVHMCHGQYYGADWKSTSTIFAAFKNAYKTKLLLIWGTRGCTFTYVALSLFTLEVTPADVIGAYFWEDMHRRWLWMAHSNRFLDSTWQPRVQDTHLLVAGECSYTTSWGSLMHIPAQCMRLPQEFIACLSRHEKERSFPKITSITIIYQH